MAYLWQIGRFIGQANQAQCQNKGSARTGWQGAATAKRAVAQRRWQALPSQTQGSWKLSQSHRTHNQLSPGHSLRMVAAFRPVLACDSISNRKATYRHPRSCTTRYVSPSQRGIIRRGIAYRAPASWRCKPGCTATQSARFTASWKPMAWWRPWQAQASTCATNKNHGT